jgi:hypothetical protein
MNDQRCETCRFSGGEQNNMDCRRRSPIGMIVQDYGRPELHTRWPRVHFSAWCGEWEQKPATSEGAS